MGSGQRDPEGLRGRGGGVSVLGHQSDVGAVDKGEVSGTMPRLHFKQWFDSRVCGWVGVPVTLPRGAWGSCRCTCS